MQTTEIHEPTAELRRPAPMSPPSAPSVPTPTWPAGAEFGALVRRALRDSAYVLTAFPLALAGFVLSVTGLSAGIGTLIIWVGVPVLVGTLVGSTLLARLERRRLGWVTGSEAHRARYLDAPGERPVRKMMTVLRDPQRWLDVVWGFVSFVSATAVFCVALTWWAIALVGTSASVWVWWQPVEDSTGLAELVGLGSSPVVEAAVNLLIGLAALAALPWVMRALAWVQSSLAGVVLNSRSELDARARRADHARAAAQQAEAASFRRLERDIHDGPQQRLVRLTMDLGRAKRQIESDPALATATVEDALRQARETLEELRALSRGIAPPLLVDRGLGVALDELVVRSAVPVEMVHELPTGLSPHVETAVYFTVSEALTNVAKHSGAAAASARVVVDADALLVQVRDDGVGGAHVSKGRGLAGLEQRLTAVGGTLEVDSPAGGPTVLIASVPLP